MQAHGFLKHLGHAPPNQKPCEATYKHAAATGLAQAFCEFHDPNGCRGTFVNAICAVVRGRFRGSI